MNKIFVKIVFLSLLISFNTKAWQNCGQIGGTDSNCEYDISSDGVLTIRPINTNEDAIMPDYQYTYNPTLGRVYETTAPWYDQRENITSIKIENGIKNIGKDSFMELRWATSAFIADSVTSINADAFTLACALSDVTLSKNLRYIASGAFQGTISLQNITLPEGLNYVSTGIFNNQNAMTSLAIPDSLIDSENFSVQALERSQIATLYCSKEKEQACADYIKQAEDAGWAPQGLSYELYEKWGTGYLYKGKFYDQLGDIGTPKHIKKRIYTVGEAQKVVGEKNRVSITYR